MAYRRRQGITRVSTFKEDNLDDNHNHNQSSVPFSDELINNNKNNNNNINNNNSSSSLSSPSPSLAAQAIRASAAHRESSLSSAYGDSAFVRDSQHRVRSENSGPYEDASSMTNESKYGFWGVLARKAKSILDDENEAQQFETTGRRRSQMLDNSSGNQFHEPHQQKVENPRFRKGLDALTSSLNQIGDSFEKAFEEGRTIVENKTADIIQETRKLQIRRKGNESDAQSLSNGVQNSWQKHLQPIQPTMQLNQQNQLKASRDVAMATAAKAKLLLRELKTVKADLAFAKERCAQLEEENKVIRDSRVKGNNHADDDLIRLQLETLLAEKARLAHENSIYARENRFLREIVEYHQLTMQDVVYLDEGSEEVTEVYPFSIPGVSGMLSDSPTSPRSPPSPVTEKIFPPLFASEENDEDISASDVSSSPGSNAATPHREHSERRSTAFS